MQQKIILSNSTNSKFKADEEPKSDLEKGDIICEIRESTSNDKEIRVNFGFEGDGEQ